MKNFASTNINKAYRIVIILSSDSLLYGKYIYVYL